MKRKVKVEFEINIPKGYKFVRYDFAKLGEKYVDIGSSFVMTNNTWLQTIIKYFIVEKCDVSLKSLKVGDKFKVKDGSKDLKVYTKIRFKDFSSPNVNYAISDTDCYSFSSSTKVERV